MPDIEDIRQVFRLGATDPILIARRFDLAERFAKVFHDLGVELQLAGRLLGGDRVSGVSPWGNGSDETVAVALLLDVGSQLIGGCASLFSEGRYYAGAALLRQLVEVEYLAWAFAKRESDGERWLRSDRQEREEFFRPARIRRASGGSFRDIDYGYHCELGGHPVPRAEKLFRPDAGDMAQLLLSDGLGHVASIWNHALSWAADHGYSASTERHGSDLADCFNKFWDNDPLSHLPPPPLDIS